MQMSRLQTFIGREDGHRPIIGRDLFSQLGLSLTKTTQVSNVDQNQCLMKKQIAFDFPGLISRIGKSLKHTVKSTFRKHFTPTNKKIRRVRISFQPLVNTKLKKLLDERHIIKLSSCSDRNFKSPIVTTVKRDETVQLALDSKTFYKNLYTKINTKCLILII